MSKKIVIDSGHGGEDGGASGNGIIEKDLTLKISKYMQQRFDELGIRNQMTRTEDITLNPTDRVNKVLSFYGDGKDVIVLSNHINAGGGEGADLQSLGHQPICVDIIKLTQGHIHKAQGHEQSVSGHIDDLPGDAVCAAADFCGPLLFRRHFPASDRPVRPVRGKPLCGRSTRGSGCCRSHGAVLFIFF